MRLSSAYDRNEFIDFVQDEFLPEDFARAAQDLSVGQKGRIRSARLLGASKSLRLKVIEFEHEGERDPRVNLSRESFRLMREYNFENALAAYRNPGSDSWRLSLITTELEYDEDKKKVRRAFSNPRRYSFLLGPGAKLATATKMLVAQGRVADKADLHRRFSLEVVNKDFYAGVATLFSKLAGGTRLEGQRDVEYPGLLELPGNPERKIKQEFAVRLIGRTVFCWFLKQKGLIKDGFVSSAQVKTTKGYYHKVLETLFFQVLNAPLAERAPAHRNPDYDAVPFLNGGLFSPHLKDFYDYDAATEISRAINTLKIPDEWLAEFFELLEKYNFTVDENTTVDIDLSIDPEMLGRIFENLLAEINPETGDTARRQTGSFYTPRSIVDFMVTESLRSFVVRSLWPKAEGEERGALLGRAGELFAYEAEELHFDAEERERLIDALHELKCLDPACGSGAFPMGILQKALLALERLDPAGERWLQKKLDGIGDAMIRAQSEELLKAKNYAYIHKLGLIENCIYGIDIQPIAVEIAKLRAFLALIVDEEVDEAKPNRGIEALPNLEFKFVCADSLIALPGVTESTWDRDLGEDSHTLKELEVERSRYLSCSGATKERAKRRYRELQDRLFFKADWAGKTGGKSYALATWDPFADEASSWFDPFWMFGLKRREGGYFDIVIANPPYVSLQKHASKEEYKKQKYSTFAARGDIYCLFYERGIQLLAEGGSLCYITSNKWMRAAYGEALRGWFMGNARIATLIDFGDAQLFENATTYTDIFLGSREAGGQGQAIPAAYDLSKTVTVDSDMYKLVREAPTMVPVFGPESYLILTEAELALKNKIEGIGTPLRKWDIDISRGIITGLNKAFIIDGATKERLVAEDPASAEIIRPLLRGRDIKRYSFSFADKWIILAKFGSHQYLERKYPAIYRHLSQFKDKLEARGQCKYSRSKSEGAGAYPGQHHWLELDNNPQDDYLGRFEHGKIIYPNMTSTLPFYYDDGSFYTNQKCFILSGKHLRFLTGVFSSTMFKFLFTLKFPLLMGQTYELSKVFVGPLPVARPDSEIAKRPSPVAGPENCFAGLSIATAIEKAVPKIQSLKAKGQDSSAWEAAVDELVYALYDLRPEEIALVETAVKKNAAATPEAEPKGDEDDEDDN